MSVKAQKLAPQTRRNQIERPNPGAAFASRTLIGACIGSAVALYGYLATASTPAAAQDQLQSVAFMAAGLSVSIIIFMKVQMALVSSRPHKMKTHGVKKEVFVRRRPEVLAWILRRWIVFLVCVGVALGALTIGLKHYKLPLPTEPVKAAVQQVAQMGQDATLLLFALALGGTTLLLSETAVRLTMKVNLPHQASWVYLSAIGSMTATLLRLARI